MHEHTRTCIPGARTLFFLVLGCCTLLSFPLCCVLLRDWPRFLGIRNTNAHAMAPLDDWLTYLFVICSCFGSPARASPSSILHRADRGRGRGRENTCPASTRTYVPPSPPSPIGFPVVALSFSSLSRLASAGVRLMIDAEQSWLQPAIDNEGHSLQVTTFAGLPRRSPVPRCETGNEWIGWRNTLTTGEQTLQTSNYEGPSLRPAIARLWRRLPGTIHRPQGRKNIPKPCLCHSVWNENAI